MKTLTLPNFNKKLSCDTFIDIGPAPATPISEAEFPRTVKILGGEKEFQAQLISMLRYKLREIPSILAILSSGLNTEGFQEYYLQRYPHSFPDMEVAVYVYRKIQDPSLG